MDFDGNLAATFADSPHGENVHTATDKAVMQVFGNEGFAVYEAHGGMQNREPGEIVRQIVRDLGKGEQGYTDITEDFVAAKLAILVPEISPEWPLLYPGVKDFFRQVDMGDIPLDIAIVSSGHDGFIKQVFAVNDLPDPEILVTSDILRSRTQPLRERYKPSPYQLAEAHRQWENREYGYELRFPVPNSYIGRGHDKGRIAYMGDDPKKDGGLARNARIPYIYVPFTKPGFDPDETSGQLMVEDFNDLSDMLKEQSEAMRSGESFARIMFGRSDAELFPPVSESERPYAKMMEAAARSRQERL